MTDKPDLKDCDFDRFERYIIGLIFKFGTLYTEADKHGLQELGAKIWAAQEALADVADVVDRLERTKPQGRS